jgi:spore coat polysaccharide biosynthesis protein SpsF
VTRTKSEQERFWEGEFGDRYTERNLITPESRQPFFAWLLGAASGVRSVCEFGANTGHNLLALRAADPSLELAGVEPNRKAFEALSALPDVAATASSIQEYTPRRPYDLVFTCGVLIHLDPAALPDAYRKLAASSARYVLINEYFNPVPLELAYREHRERLFKRDFGAEFLEANDGRARVVDYGFLWHEVEPGWDNTTWWLFEKR